MVVRRGEMKAAIWMLSIPTAETLPGTDKPLSWMARIAPTADTSLNARTAVKSRDFCINIIAAS
jgi:hypothetical protein